jgi:hypothetical protein
MAVNAPVSGASFDHVPHSALVLKIASEESMSMMNWTKSSVNPSFVILVPPGPFRSNKHPARGALKYRPGAMSTFTRYWPAPKVVYGPGEAVGVGVIEVPPPHDVSMPTATRAAKYFTTAVTRLHDRSESCAIARVNRAPSRLDLPSEHGV